MTRSGFTSQGTNLAPPSGGDGDTLIGVCGKHRSYQEHFEDVARQPRLIAIKEAIYDRGLRAAVDAGVWRDLKGEENADRYVPFDHTMVGRRIAGAGSQEWVVGVVARSPDSIGRDAYPLLIFATGATSVPMTSLEKRATRLRTLLTSVMAATSLGEVQGAIGAAREGRLPATATAPRPPGAPPPMPAGNVAPLVALYDDPAIGENGRGVANALREVRRRFAPKQSMADRGLHVRVPRTAGSAEAAAARWIEMLDAELRVGLPTLAFVPNDRPWIDLIVGKPAAADFFCLHASAAVVPPLSEIPYQLDPTFVAELDRRIAFLRANPSAGLASNLTASNDAGGDADGDRGRGWRRWLPW